MSATPAPLTPSDHLRVASGSDPGRLAGAISHVVRRSGRVSMDAIGAAAVNQAVKAIATAIEHLADDGIAVAAVPRYVTLEIHGHERTAMRIEVVPLPAEPAPIVTQGLDR